MVIDKDFIMKTWGDKKPIKEKINWIKDIEVYKKRQLLIKRKLVVETKLEDNQKIIMLKCKIKH